MLMALDLAGRRRVVRVRVPERKRIAIACPAAIGVAPDVANAAVRMSLGALTTDEHVGRVAELFPALAEKARRLDRIARVTRPRVLAAMSGGVDSSVAAAVLAERGFDVIGVTMKLFCHGDDIPDRPCCSLESINDARRVCELIGIPHYVLNMERTFGRDVVDDFVAEYARGRTPIPCVRCNTFTKFRDLVAKADALDAPWIATGHYARAEGGVMRRGRDAHKDQSYFLWGIDRAVCRASPPARR